MRNLNYLFSVICIFVLYFVCNTYGYTSGTHQYILQESYNLLKYEKQYRYEDIDIFFQQLNEGIYHEDEQDWVYSYSTGNILNMEINGDLDEIIDLLIYNYWSGFSFEDLLAEIAGIINELETEYLASVTHF